MVCTLVTLFFNIHTHIHSLFAKRNNLRGVHIRNHHLLRTLKWEYLYNGKTFSLALSHIAFYISCTHQHHFENSVVFCNVFLSTSFVGCYSKCSVSFSLCTFHERLQTQHFHIHNFIFQPKFKK